MIDIKHNEIVNGFLNGLPVSAQDKFNTYFGYYIENQFAQVQWVGNLHGHTNLYYFRVRSNNMFYRIFFSKFADCAYTLYGFRKVTDDTPDEEIQRAIIERNKIQEYLENK